MTQENRDQVSDQNIPPLLALLIKTPEDVVELEQIFEDDERSLDILAVGDLVREGNPLALKLAAGVVNEGYIKEAGMRPLHAWLKWGHEYRKIRDRDAKYSDLLKEELAIRRSLIAQTE